MALYKQWTDLVDSHQTQADMEDFWKGYFDQEKNNYAQILSTPDQIVEGTVTELAARFDMTPVTFVGFLDGINDSLTQAIDLEQAQEDTGIKLDINYELLYFNMLEAKADWLYNLPQWDDIISVEKRKEITKEYRASKIAVSTKIGRNEPCTCGSGKKYKKCCGA